MHNYQKPADGSAQPFATAPTASGSAPGHVDEAHNHGTTATTPAAPPRTRETDVLAADVMSHWVKDDPIQSRAVATQPSQPDIQKSAALGLSGAPTAFPYLDQIQKSFGPKYDLSGVSAFIGGTATLATQQMGAEAYATGLSAVYGRQPSPYTAAHEAAHIIQQRHGVSLPGGVGSEGDAYERQADAIADRVVAGQSAQDLLDAIAMHGAHGPHAKSSAGTFSAVQMRKGPEIPTTQKALGEHVVSGVEALDNSPHGPDIGVHYAHNYKRDYPIKWNDDWWSGHADPHYFIRYGFMKWELKPGKSASQAIKKWLNGLTIAECLSSIIAVQIDAIRAALGDDRFDELYGSNDAKSRPEAKRLRISQTTSETPLQDNMMRTRSAETGDAGKPGHRPAEKGEWHYMYNHPKYLLKHPGGAWQGENAICLGEDKDGHQLWSGFGAQNMTEDAMLTEMVKAYNDDRDARDLEILENIKRKHGGTLPPEYDSKGGFFSATITKKDILSAPAYAINGTTRKGGFVPGAGKVLDSNSIKGLK